MLLYNGFLKTGGRLPWGGKEGIKGNKEEIRWSRVFGKKWGKGVF